MAIDLQKLEQKFNALFEDENIVAEFEQWLEARNVSQNSSKPIVGSSLPTLEDAWNAGVDEGGSRTGNFEWGIRRKDVEFSDWYKAELHYRSLGQ